MAEFVDTPDLVINRYEHGGARVYLVRNGKRDLVMDIYGTEERREVIIKAVLATGILN